MVIDGRKGVVSEYREVPRIMELCRKYSTDGLMILLPSSSGLSRGSHVDFVMEFYNPDGSGGMMCGNGGRCIVAFAHMLGLKPAAEDGTWHFLAPDGPHEAKILSGPQSVIPGHDRESRWTVRLKMIDVKGVTPMKNGFFLNTGTRHYVEFRNNVDSIDMEKEAKPLRWDPAFQPEGTNVNFVERRQDGLHIRTYEKGVEGETLACGTGITASAIAAYYAGRMPAEANAEYSDGQCRDRRPLAGHGTALCPSRLASAGIRLQARRGDILTVDFVPAGPAIFREIHLTGPAEFV